MSYCFICGQENNLTFRPDVSRYICKRCNKTTPKKIPKSEFDIKYWGEKFEEVPTFIRNEFYDDYRSSSSDLEDYIKGTQSDL